MHVNAQTDCTVCQHQLSPETGVTEVTVGVSLSDH